jgi:hypothetical protein
MGATKETSGRDFFPSELGVEQAEALAAEVDAIRVGDLAAVLQRDEIPDPIDLLRILTRVLEQSEKVNTLLRKATLALATVRERRQREEHRRKREIDRIISDGEADTGGTAAERLIVVEALLEHRRQKTAGDENLPSFQEIIAGLKGLEARWKAVVANADAQRKLLKQADQLGRLAQKVCSGALAPPSRGGGPPGRRYLPSIEEDDEPAVPPGTT